eukprot:TRINITY_DN4004_c1_g1_i3.p1 TRINITY_DN4004_c1_g1~~TRINITY_DN4004_c1_g1_i3.p1  ORF type:complete len:1157 (-),score=308.35 TRINITY_DN4004_c1_g1_i3:359-3766(-)
MMMSGGGGGGGVVSMCVVGAGTRGRARLAVISRTAGVACEVVVEPDEAAAAIVRRDFPDVQVFASLARLAAHLAQTERKQRTQKGRVSSEQGRMLRIDGIWVCTGVRSRADLIAEATKMKIAKYIYCEAPIALSVHDVQTCYDICQKRDCELLTGWTSRFDEKLYSLISPCTELCSARLCVVKASAQPPSPPLGPDRTPDDADNRKGVKDKEKEKDKAKERKKTELQELLDRSGVVDLLNLTELLMEEKIPTAVHAVIPVPVVPVADNGGGNTAAATAVPTAATATTAAATPSNGTNGNCGNGDGDGTYNGYGYTVAGTSTAAIINMEYPGGKVITVESVKCLGQDAFGIVVSAVRVDGQVVECGRGEMFATQAERFAEAMSQEVQYFREILNGEAVVRICKPEHCYVTAKLYEMIVESLTESRAIIREPGMRLLQIGKGRFGSYVQESVLPRLAHVETVAVASREHSQLELDSLMARKDIEGVYVCTPYDAQTELVAKALRYRKKVLCEKPLLNLSQLQQIAEANDQFLAIAFHRRFDPEYIKAKEYIKHATSLHSLVLESRDVIASTEDTIDALYTSVVNDIDTVTWLFDDVDCQMSIKSVKVYGPGSSITIVIAVWFCKYDTYLDVQINYGRDFPSFRQQVVVDGKRFGYDSKDACYWSVYAEAYRRQFEWFGKVGSTPGQGNFCQVYTRTHELLSEAVDRVSDEQDLMAVTKHLSHHGLMSPKIEPVVEEFKEFKGVAGHGGMLVCGGRIYKPLASGENEWHIYTLMKERLPALKQYIPKIYDQVRVNDVAYLVMKNLLEGYVNPRVLDLKVGEPSDLHKIPNQSFGIRVAGYTNDNFSRRAVQSYNDIVSFFKDFLKDRELNSYRYEEVPYWLERLRGLKQVFEEQTEFRMCAASLLFIYDSVDNEHQKPTVVLIDMGRAKENSRRVDHMFCFGLRNLITMLEEIHRLFTSRHAIFLCRHGFRVDYEDLTWVPKATYPHDPPLSSEGMRQAQDLAERLKYENIDAIVSSPFTRALHTAKIMAEILHVKYVVEPALSEFMSVTNRRGIPNLDPTMTTGPLVDSSYKKIFKNITLENWDSMCERVHESLVRLSRTYKRIAIVSHRSTFQVRPPETVIFFQACTAVLVLSFRF